jgi:hypothetical protein
MLHELDDATVEVHEQLAYGHVKMLPWDARQITDIISLPLGFLSMIPSAMS